MLFSKFLDKAIGRAAALAKTQQEQVFPLMDIQLYINFYLGITTLTVRPLVGYLVDRKREWGFNLSMTVGTIGIAAAMIVIAGISTLPHLIIGGLLHGFGFGIVQPAVLAKCLKAAPEENKGAANATYWTTFDIRVALGSAFWGLVVVWTGYYWMFIISVIPALCGFLLYLLKVTLAARNNLQGMKN